MLPIPTEAQSQFGVFTWAQAVKCGWTPASIRHAVRRDRLTRVRRGVYAGSEVLAGQAVHDRDRHLAARSAAAVLGIDGSAASHRSSAVLAGLPTLTRPETPCLTVAPRRQSIDTDVHLHRAGLDGPDAVVLSSAVRRTSSSRTVLDIARECGVDEAVVVADAALRGALTDARRLRRELDFCDTWPGMARARRAVSLSDGRAESPLESISRLRIGESGLPTPELQVDICDGHGLLLGRGDFYWERYGVVGEADGMGKYDDPVVQPLRREKFRQEALEQSGLVVVRWNWSDLDDCPELFRRIKRALHQGSRRTADERRWFARSTG